MSLHAMAMCWGADLPPNELLVLMAMADHADHTGRNVRPGGRLLAAKTGYDVRSIKRIQARLITRGLLEKVRRLSSGQWDYRIVLERIPKTSTYETVIAEYEAREEYLAARSMRGDNLSPAKVTPVSPAKVTSQVTPGDKMSPAKVTPRASKVTSQVAVRKEPLEPKKEEKSGAPAATPPEFFDDEEDGIGTGEEEAFEGTDADKDLVFTATRIFLTQIADPLFTEPERRAAFRQYIATWAEAESRGSVEVELRLLRTAQAIHASLRQPETAVALVI